MAIWILGVGLGVTFVVAVLALIGTFCVESGASHENKETKKELEQQITENKQQTVDSHRAMMYRTCREHEWKYLHQTDKWSYNDNGDWCYISAYQFECRHCGHEMLYTKEELPTNVLKSMQDIGIIDKPKPESKSKKKVKK